VSGETGKSGKSGVVGDGVVGGVIGGGLRRARSVRGLVLAPALMVWMVG